MLNPNVKGWNKNWDDWVPVCHILMLNPNVKGWNKNWDEWVPESRMLKQVAENYEKQKRLLSSHVAQTKANRKAKKEASKIKGPGKGGSDSNSNSR